MTKREAAEKVAKLMKLARGSTNPHESSTARKQADKIARENDLTTQDLEVGEMGAAFDDLADQVGKLVPSLPTAGMFNTQTIVRQVIESIKTIDKSDKAARLRQIVSLVRGASFFAGDNKTIAEIKTILDSTLKNHQLVI